jgi:hypothetical protein
VVRLPLCAIEASHGAVRPLERLRDKTPAMFELLANENRSR